MIAENYIQYYGRAGQGLAGLKVTLGGYFQTFLNFHMRMEDRVITDEKIVARATFMATHSTSRATRTQRAHVPTDGQEIDVGRNRHMAHRRRKV